MVFCCKITIGDLTLDSASEIEINKTWKKFTQTANIKIPRNLYFQKGNQVFKIENLKDFIKRGDKVKIELGYNTQLMTEFEGYVSRTPTMSIPYEIECEDEMWLLKNKIVSVHIQDATVKQILQKTVPEYAVSCIDELYGDFSMNEVTPVKIFNELRLKSGLYTFFRQKRLVCGVPYSDKSISTHIPTYTMGKTIIESDIRLDRDEYTKLKVYGSSVKANGEIRRFNKGEEGGTRIVLHFDLELTHEELKKAVEDKYSFNRTLGNVSGSIKTFGFPFVEHGQVIRYLDEIKEKIDEKLFIDEININVSSTIGYKKTIVVGKIQTA
jgi:hypothetical protein